ncbi:MAG TPA: amidophosphoribosyltransferase [Candidatus Saccharimonadales bacterium]|nr:amidophosphoribosyltransferase [Candidatus Saccharimonadales bacterium]
METTHELREKCAVFGVYGSNIEAARLTFYGLWALQHRGQESSGIVSSDGEQLHRHIGPGLVANVYREEDLQQLPGSIAIGHNRYSTSGGAHDQHAQPVLKRDRQIAVAHNGNLPITRTLQAFLQKHGIVTSQLNDSEMMATAIDCFIAEGAELPEAIEKTYPMLQGAFSVVAASTHQLLAFRDRCGIRPLSLGKLGDALVVASETCAFDTIGATFLRDIRPGEMIIIDEHGVTSRQIVKGEQKLDIFEMVYFARPDSLLLGQRVNQVRENLGRELAREYKIDADIVVPIPDSAIPAALGYARESGVQFEMGIMKNRYIHRTFIRPTQELRERDLKMKLIPVAESLQGKRVIIIDDSIVRGTTLRKIGEMIYGAGAKELHILVSSPPICYPDFYGINTPDAKDLIAATKTVAQIRDYLGVDSLGYLSYDGMIRATNLPKETFSTSCFDGVYPIPVTEATSAKPGQHAKASRRAVA